MKPGLDASMEYFSSGATESEEDPLQVNHHTKICRRFSIHVVFVSVAVVVVVVVQLKQFFLLSFIFFPILFLPAFQILFFESFLYVVVFFVLCVRKVEVYSTFSSPRMPVFPIIRFFFTTVRIILQKY